MRHILLTAPFLFFFFSAYSQCIDGDCNNGSGLFILENGDKYNGNFKNGKFNGNGTCYYTDGSKYTGEWEKNKPHGKGKKTLIDGREYNGWWKKGHFIKEDEFLGKQADNTENKCLSGNCANGQGTMIFANGAIYNGQFINGEINGSGVCYYPDGSQYRGQWKRRLPDGYGTKSFPDGRKISGNWRKGRPLSVNSDTSPSSPADFSDNTAPFQIGCLSGNCINGKGVFAYPDGSLYDGNFLQHKPNNQGTFFYPNGDKYVGGFKNGYQHGYGTIFYDNGGKKQGVWRDGEFINRKMTAGRLGCIEGNCENGTGVYLYEDGVKYKGTFKDGMPSGKGLVSYPNGEKYSGQMREGAFYGIGVFTMTDGTTLKGQWRKGIYLGQQSQATAQNTRPYNRPKPKQNLKIWALIIGISSYEHMPALKYPDDDAYRIFAFLKSPEGGAVPDEQMKLLIDEDATRYNIFKAMKEIYSKAGPNDLILTYYSGHGKKGAFLPIDYDGYKNQILHTDISKELSKSRAKYKLFIADACHSGSLFSEKSNSSRILDDFYNQLAQAKSGTALIMSSKANETSLESNGLRQGVFTHFLIRGLKGEADKNNDYIINVQELYDYVYKNVTTYTNNRQTPVIRGTYDPKMMVAVKR